MSGVQRIWDTLFNRLGDDRLRRLEAKVDVLYDRLGLELHDSAKPLSDEVKALAGQPRKKFAAIKLHRQRTGVGLNEAEAAVAAHIRSLRRRKKAARI